MKKFQKPKKMEEGFDKKEGRGKSVRREIFSKAVRAGKRTYFFDVKATRRNDYFMTITESKKRYRRDGRFYYEKHKIFLYKEDFDRFLENLMECLEFIRSRKGSSNEVNTEEFEASSSYANLEFDDLENTPEEIEKEDE